MTVRSKAKITAKNQLTLPRPVRERLGVGAGDELVFDIGEDQVTVAPAHVPGRFAKFAGRHRIGQGRPAGETLKFLRRLRGR